MNIRYPVRDGTFYEGAAATCRHQAQKVIQAAKPPTVVGAARLYGGLVPHAGWMYSGRIAATTFLALSQPQKEQTFVLLGADHVGTALRGEVFDSGVWQTPLGQMPVDDRLAAAILAGGGALRSNPSAHAHEHSLEVQVPLIQLICPQAKIVPIQVPPTEEAVEIGRRVGAAVKNYSGSAVIVGSTDLTHHAGHFPAPGGRGTQGVTWTVKNDRRMLDLIEAMKAEQIVHEACEHGNACGAGAIAATIAACRELGACRGITQDYSNSYEVIHALYPQESDDTTVGYASVVFA